MTTVVISQPMLFPWIGMYEQLALADVFVHYDDVQFSKGSFTNRVQVRDGETTRWLTIPVKPKGLETTIAELSADDTRPWRSDHLALLRRSYAEFRHADAMLDLVEQVYDANERFVDVVINGFERLAEVLPVTMPATVTRSSRLGISGSGSQRVLDVVLHFGGTRYVTGHGARKYLDHERFEAAGVAVVYLDYDCPAYAVPSGTSTPFVSAIDRLAALGPGGGPPISGSVIDWRAFVASPVLVPQSSRFGESPPG